MFSSLLFVFLLLMNPFASSDASNKAIASEHVVSQASHVPSTEALVPSTQASHVPSTEALVPSTEELGHDLDITIHHLDDEAFRTEAWASLDALSDTELDEYGLGDMRVSIVGTTSEEFATQSLFTVNNGDIVYVFSKTKNHSSETPMSHFSAAEQSNLAINLPTCEDDVYVTNCLIENDKGDYTSVVF